MNTMNDMTLTSVRLHVPDAAPDLEDAMYIVKTRLDENNVPDDGRRVGAQGRKREPFEWCGIRFTYHRLMGSLVAAWHEDAVVPPATVLQPKGVAYCQILNPL